MSGIEIGILGLKFSAYFLSVFDFWKSFTLECNHILSSQNTIIQQATFWKYYGFSQKTINELNQRPRKSYKLKKPFADVINSADSCQIELLTRRGNNEYIKTHKPLYFNALTIYSLSVGCRRVNSSLRSLSNFV